MKSVEGTLSALDVIYARRSVRAYASTPIQETTIRALLDAAVQAPSALDAEPWAFVIVRDRGRLRRLSDLAKVMWTKDAAVLRAVSGLHDDFVTRMSEPDFDIFYGAPVLVVICARGNDAFAIGDCWLAAQNLMLAACALGLGTCCIGSAVTALNSAEMRLDLAIPPNMTAVAPIIVGVPDSSAEAVAHREPEIIAWK